MNTGSQLLLAAFFAVSVAACDRPADNRTEGATGTSGEASALDMGERNFVQEQIKDGLAEVKLGELAEKQASSPDVKQFASTMVQDHTRAGNQLKEIAQRENVELEAEPGLSGEVGIAGTLVAQDLKHVDARAPVVDEVIVVLPMHCRHNIPGSGVL